MNNYENNNQIIGYDTQTGQPIYKQQTNEIKREKLSTSFKVSYIVSFVLFFISIVIFVSMTRLETGYITTNILSGLIYLFWSIIFFIVSLGTMILSIILGIKNKKRITNKTLKNRIIGMIWVISISHALIILYLIVDIYINPSALLESKKIPEYDFNEVWSCYKYDLNSTRTYTFKENGSVEAVLDSDPENYYLIGSYSIEAESIDDSIYTGERDGKIKSYTLNITFDEFVDDGIQTNMDSVSWYIDVYNGNYMKLTVPGGSYTCTMK